jgi:hypothetical protein
MLRHRKPLKITQRISSVTNGFVQAILPVTPPSFEQEAAVFQALGQTADAAECVYCGNRATDWDHLRPLVAQRRPTGNLTDYRNLVPACGPCNQSKGGQPWHDWMTGRARGSPSAREDLNLRIERLQAFERWGAYEPIDIETVVEAGLWSDYWARLHDIDLRMRAAQKLADQIQIQVAAGLAEKGQ